MQSISEDEENLLGTTWPLDFEIPTSPVQRQADGPMSFGMVRDSYLWTRHGAIHDKPTEEDENAA